MCREEAFDLCSLVNGVQGAPPVIGVCKEEESEEKPDELGIDEFATKYFGCGALHINEGRELFSMLGDRKIGLPMEKLLNPFRWGEVKSDLAVMKERMESKGVEGNMKGDGLVQGGVLVVGPAPACEVRYTYYEETGSELPVQEIDAAVKDLVKGTAVAAP